MRTISLWLVTVTFFIAPFGAGAQKAKSEKLSKNSRKPAPVETKAADPGQNETRVKGMVAFLAFLLNTLGSSNTSPRDKDVVITESYSKIFRDAKVQVEDDLDEERGVITNKDVVAYLKDVSFFFKDVKFEFNVDKIETGINNENQQFYKVSLHRNLSGTTSEGKPVNNSVPRFIEINVNPKDQDLKIVSIYTKEIDEKEALQNWWKQLSFEWLSFFRKEFELGDSVKDNDIRKVTVAEELNLSNNRLIQSFEPLSQFKNLKRLNLSNTEIIDLSPLRNLTDLVDLNLSHTAVRDLSPLKYSSNLTKLNIDHTKVNDIGIVQRMPKMVVLEMGNTPVSDFSAVVNLSELVVFNCRNTRLSELPSLENLKQLTNLDISGTRIHDLAMVRGLKNLKTMACDSTPVRDIGPLAQLDNLKILRINYTSVGTLLPLQNLAHLEKIYCDQTPIEKSAAESFMASNHKVLVVYDSRDLRSWWDSLSPGWQEVICNAAEMSPDPSKEELARVWNIDSINVSGNERIQDLEPLSKFQKLRVLIAGKTGISDLSPVRENREIIYLDISQTDVTNLSPLDGMPKLKVLKADQCKLDNFDFLRKSIELEEAYVDGTGINDINAREILEVNPTCLLVYKTVHLNRWWRNLPEVWKPVFKARLPDTTRESFHRLVEQESFHFKDVPVTDLSGFTEFVRLKELNFSGTAITVLAPVESMKRLKILGASHGPIQNIELLRQLTYLEELDISNTPLEDLSAAGFLKDLRKLNCSGTQIKHLDALEKLEKLEFLDCSNTNVTKLVPLDYLHLKLLKCYNTRVSNRAIENYKASHPECNITYFR